MKPSTDMTTGIAERVGYGLILGICMKLVAHGWFDAEMAPYIAAGVVSLVGGVWAWWLNRPKALLQSASNVVGEDGKKTLIYTSPELAAATPETNIKSNINVKGNIK